MTFWNSDPVLWPWISCQFDLTLLCLECYLSFLYFLIHKVNRRCPRIRPAEVSNTIVIQLTESPRRIELFTCTQTPRMTLERPNLCCFLGLLFHMVMFTLVPGMKIIWIKLKPVPFKAKAHNVCLLDWLIFIKYGISNCTWGQRQMAFFFFFWFNQYERTEESLPSQHEQWSVFWAPMSNSNKIVVFS